LTSSRDSSLAWDVAWPYSAFIPNEVLCYQCGRRMWRMKKLQCSECKVDVSWMS
jgi:hypothetical protein